MRGAGRRAWWGAEGLCFSGGETLEGWPAASASGICSTALQRHCQPAACRCPPARSQKACPCSVGVVAPPSASVPAGDDEEIERFWKELGLTEKGKVLVKGILQG